MARIAKYTAEQIARAAVRDTLGVREQALKDRWHGVSERAWKTLTPKPVQEWLAKAPKGDWVKKQTEMRVRGSNGYVIVLKFKEAMPADREWGYGREPIIKDAGLTEELMACVQEQEKLAEAWQTLGRQLTMSILAAGSFKKLELAWPEGRAYYASYLNAENTGTALTVDFKEVNKSLGLPKDEAAKPAAPRKRKAA